MVLVAWVQVCFRENAMTKDLTLMAPRRRYDPYVALVDDEFISGYEKVSNMLHF